MLRREPLPTSGLADVTLDPHEPEVSFVVICFNEEANITKCLDAVLAQRGSDVREVLVVDDGSTDRTAERVATLAAAHPVIRLIRLPGNMGRGFARKAGCDEARGYYLAYVDADTVLPPEWLERCLSSMADADAVGGVAVPDGDLSYVHRRSGLQPRAIPGATTVTGSNGLYRREIFTRVAFDPALREGEDVALNHQLRAGGARTCTLTDLLVRHEETKTFGESVRWLFESGRGATRQLWRYRKIRIPDLVFFGWITLLGNATVGPGRRSAAARALPAAYIAAAATQHVRRGFVWEARKSHRWFAAVVIDACLLTAYMVGRLAGLTGMRRP